MTSKPAPENALPIDDHLCFAMYSANMAIHRLYRPLLEQLGVTYPQYLVLNLLWEEDDRSITAIAERLALETSTVTPLVKRLESAGYVERSRRKVDERRVGVTLTDKGRALRRESRCLTDTLLKTSGLSVAEIVRLNQEVRALRDTLAKASV